MFVYEPNPTLDSATATCKNELKYWCKNYNPTFSSCPTSIPESR